MAQRQASSGSQRFIIQNNFAESYVGGEAERVQRDNDERRRLRQLAAMRAQQAYERDVYAQANEYTIPGMEELADFSQAAWIVAEKGACFCVFLDLNGPSAEDDAAATNFDGEGVENSWAMSNANYVETNPACTTGHKRGGLLGLSGDDVHFWETHEWNQHYEHMVGDMRPNDRQRMEIEEAQDREMFMGRGTGYARYGVDEDVGVTDSQQMEPKEARSAPIFPGPSTGYKRCTTAEVIASWAATSPSTLADDLV